MFNKINGLSKEELMAKSRSYFQYLKSRYQNEPGSSGKWLSKLFKDQTYLESMKQDEMRALVCIEYLKFILGKSHHFDVGFFSSARTPKGAS